MPRGRASARCSWGLGERKRHRCVAFAHDTAALTRNLQILRALAFKVLGSMGSS